MAEWRAWHVFRLFIHPKLMRLLNSDDNEFAPYE
jgi:hypothetical protein